MSRLHAFLVFGVAACGGGSATPDAAKAIDAPKAIDAAHDAPLAIDAMIDAMTDAMIDAGPMADAAMAAGTMHHYVANHEEVPATTAMAKSDGLDLNGDNVVDNQFGMVLASFSGMGISTQATVDTAIAKGTTIILAALQTTDFTTSTASGFAIYSGANPNPPACTGPTDTVCGHQFTGSATFDLATGALVDPPLVGNFLVGVMTTPVGDSTMPLPLAFGSTPFTVNMIGARVQVSAASATGFTAILAGAINSTEMTTKVYPAFQTTVMGLINADCNALTSPPACGCTQGSTGAELISLLDTNQDCHVTVAEIMSNQLISSLFAPDVTIDGQLALSIGVKITTVGATFTGP